MRQNTDRSRAGCWAALVVWLAWGATGCDGCRSWRCNGSAFQDEEYKPISPRTIRVEVMDAEGRQITDRAIQIDLFRGSTQEEAKNHWVDGISGRISYWVSFQRRPTGGDTAIFPTVDGPKDLAPGAYWVRAIAEYYVEDTCDVRITVHTEQSIEECAAGAGFVVGRATRDPEGFWYTVTALEETPPKDSPPSSIKTLPRERTIRVHRRFTYLLPVHWFRTYVGQTEAADSVLAILDSKGEYIERLHKQIITAGGKGLIPIKARIGQFFPMSSTGQPVHFPTAKVVVNVGLTLLVRGVADLDGLVSLDTTRDIVGGAFVSAAFRDATGVFAGVLLSVVPDLYVHCVQCETLRHFSRSDDLEIQVLAQEVRGPTRHSGRLRATNRGEPIYNVHLRLVASNPAGNDWAHVLSPAREVMKPDESQEFEWSADFNPPPVAPYKPPYFCVSYDIEPVGHLNLQMETPHRYTHHEVVPLNEAGPPRSDVWIVDFLDSPGKSPSGEPMRRLAARVRNDSSRNVYLAAHAGSLAKDVDPALVERRRRQGASGPYRLGLERRAKEDEPWAHLALFGWMPAQDDPKDKVLTNTFYLPAGRTREFFSETTERDFRSSSFRAFLLDDAGGRIDEKTLHP